MSAKFVVIGDNLGQGLRSGAITNTELSYPAIAAEALSDSPFLVPDFTGLNGIPLNIEVLVRKLMAECGPDLSTVDPEVSAAVASSLVDSVEDHWVRGEGAQPSSTGPVHHNLSVWGFGLGDVSTVTGASSTDVLPPPDAENLLNQVPDFSMYRTARRTLNPTLGAAYGDLTQIAGAMFVAAQEGGIDNLLIDLGANHALRSVLALEMVWSSPDDLQRLAHDRVATIWRPAHFARAFSQLAEEIAEIGATNVFVSTIPHVTIAPVTRGVPADSRDQDGYYAYYTHFWIWDSDFDPERHPHLTRRQVRKIDATVDAYNAILRKEASAKGWKVFDLAQIMSDMAFRRNAGVPTYVLPPGLEAAMEDNPLTHVRFTADERLVMDTRFFRIRPEYNDPAMRYCGGLFSLDGLHPTVLGSGVIAFELLRAMGHEDAANRIDWTRLVNEDSLITHTPTVFGDLKTLLTVLTDHGPLAAIIRALGNLP